MNMKSLRNIVLIALTACLVTLTTGVAIAADDGMVDGVVKELRPGGELTIKHGPLTKLDMPAMTMVFKTSDPKMAKGLKVGDKIKMQVEEKGGKLTIMKLKK
jgi:Cu/Ag efflux protein CusF